MSLIFKMRLHRSSSHLVVLKKSKIKSPRIKSARCRMQTQTVHIPCYTMTGEKVLVNLSLKKNNALLPAVHVESGRELSIARADLQVTEFAWVKFLPRFNRLLESDKVLDLLNSKDFCFVLLTFKKFTEVESFLLGILQRENFEGKTVFRENSPVVKFLVTLLGCDAHFARCVKEITTTIENDRLLRRSVEEAYLSVLQCICSEKLTFEMGEILRVVYFYLRSKIDAKSASAALINLLFLRIVTPAIVGIGAKAIPLAKYFQRQLNLRREFLVENFIESVIDGFFLEQKFEHRESRVVEAVNRLSRLAQALKWADCGIDKLSSRILLGAYAPEMELKRQAILIFLAEQEKK